MEKQELLKWITGAKQSIDAFNAEVVRVMKLNDITDKTIQGNYRPKDIQYLLDGIEQCNFTDEQISWINQIILVVNTGDYYDMMKEFKPKAYEKEVKEEVKGWGNFRGLKF
jgi:nicotinic acid phosphoribosyltransferase